MTAPTEYRVRWRRAHWTQKNGDAARTYATEAGARRRADRLLAHSDADTLCLLVIERRPVGGWSTVDTLIDRGSP